MDIKKNISIIVPSYNQGEYLDECLSSVLNQTYLDWECIIVNDGSSDNTEEIALRWLKKDSRFKYIYQENSGVSAARNKGIEKSSGTFILPLDGDDKIAERYIELALDTFSLDPALTIVYCNAEYFGALKGTWNLPDYSKRDLLIKNMIFCSALFRKSDWKLVGGYDVGMKEGYEDWEFWVNMALHIKKFNVKKLDYVGFYYRKKEVSRNIIADADPNINKKLIRYVYFKHLKYYYKIIIKNKLTKLFSI